MGVARLLAKGWVVFCLYAGGHAFVQALVHGIALPEALQSVAICVLLFGAMGLLFVAGFGASARPNAPLLARLRPRDLIPTFDDTVFVAFVAVSFAVQVYFVSEIGNTPVGQAVQKAMFSVVPGLPKLADRLDDCVLNPQRVYSISLAASIAWLLAIVYVASAASRIGLTAGLLRLQQALRPTSFGPTLLAALYGTVAIVGFQLLYIGSLYGWLGCGGFGGIGGVLLTGLAPLMLAYLIVAALVTLKASGPES
ncbi:MAG: hypothetical protein WDN01_00225 [Rhizomicrobium sp.]